MESVAVPLGAFEISRSLRNLLGVSWPEETCLAFEPPPSPEAEADALDALAAAAQRCAAAGARRVWVEPSERASLPTESLRVALFVALRCDGLRVVAAGLEVGHWIRFAEDVATADGLCGGRLELAFASLPPDALLGSLRQAWSGAPVPVAGGAPVQIHPRAPRADGPPLWACLADEEEARRAAERDVGGVAVSAVVALAHTGAARPPLPLAIVREADAPWPASAPAHAIALASRVVRAPGGGV